MNSRLVLKVRSSSRDSDVYEALALDLPRVLAGARTKSTLSPEGNLPGDIFGSLSAEAKVYVSTELRSAGEYRPFLCACLS
jgi:hypothetical protein